MAAVVCVAGGRAAADGDRQYPRARHGAGGPRAVRGAEGAAGLARERAPETYATQRHQSPSSDAGLPGGVATVQRELPTIEERI